jgi:hypothetical protein
MEFIVLDTNLEAVYTVDPDLFESAIWTDRYSAFGDFELYIPPTIETLSFLREDYYLWSGDTDHVMIIEDIRIQSDSEIGNKLVVTGRSLESVLERRIVWNQTILNSGLQDGIKKLLDDSVISPSDTTRKINNFRFAYTDDTAITGLTVRAQFTGDSVYDAIKGLCDANNLGFKIVLSSDGFFVLSLYSGADRSYNQFENPYVVFSPDFENLINSNYFASKKELKTAALVAGEGEGSERTRVEVSIDSGSESGLNRRELYADARDISSNNGEVPADKYLAQLTQRGKNKLAENSVVKSFEGQADTLHKFVYGEHFFMGDIVQIANEYGIEATSRVTEIVRSQNAEGFEVFPTFTTLE